MSTTRSNAAANEKPEGDELRTSASPFDADRTFTLSERHAAPSTASDQGTLVVTVNRPDLSRYEEACRAVSEAKCVDEAKDVRDRAEAIRIYAAQAKNRNLEMDAAEIRFRAERRLGELMDQQRQSVGLATGTRGQLKGRDSSGGLIADPPEALPTLAEAGINKRLADRARKFAVMTEEHFEGAIQQWRQQYFASEKRAPVTINLTPVQTEELDRNRSEPAWDYKASIGHIRRVVEAELKRCPAVYRRRFGCFLRQLGKHIGATEQANDSHQADTKRLNPARTSETGAGVVPTQVDPPPSSGLADKKLVCRSCGEEAVVSTTSIKRGSAVPCPSCARDMRRSPRRTKRAVNRAKPTSET